MTRHTFYLLLLMSILGSSLKRLQSQDIIINNPEVIHGTLVKITKPLYELTSQDTIYKSHPKKRKLKPGFHPKNDWILHDKVNPQALPIGPDPALQNNFSRMKAAKSPLRNFDGIPNTFVDPADPSIAVGPNHVVQMTNDSDGSAIQIWNKNGQTVKTKHIMDGITGISGAGDPIVVYDHIADRWHLTEFGDDADPNVGNRLICMVSLTNDPTGQYYVYSFATPFFPDYPKYGLWPDAYYVTTNENDAQAVYAMDRVKMLAGDQSATMQRFADISLFNTISFQASTPVNLVGSTLPPSNAPGMIMRMADDGWQGVSRDRLEMWELDINFSNSNASSLSRTQLINTQPFDTELCGYTSFECIEQPGNSQNLDPLREVLMNRIYYRNFGTHASIVTCHATDAGGDRAGIRWYELRKPNGGNWSIYQQGTYAPNDGNSRWMSSIGINADGSIGLAYNVASNSIFPSIRYTGRTSCDELGDMTITEVTAVTGTASNFANRYGDYNDMGIDPSNGSFWFTGMYNPSGNWSTRIVNFAITSNCNSNNCTDDADLNGTIANGTYQHSNELSSSGTIPSNGNVIFKGKNAVNLNLNFIVQQSGILEAQIEDCNNK